ncbi:MAG: hypothetical protein LQ345_003177 [Seirophora villosa]|nr:MAG: hypothetical protein LQ345_003177 [Seirophora villosa]
MPRETRAQKAKRDAEEAARQRQSVQQTDNPENEQPSQEEERRARPRRNRRDTLGNDQRATRARNQLRNRRSRSRRTAQEDDPGPLRQVRSGIRRRAAVRWQGTVLPRFDIPHWRLRQGVPTLLLPLLSPTDSTDAADENLDDVEDIDIDSQSDHSIPDDDGHDAQGQDDSNPTSLQELQSQEQPQEASQESPQDLVQESLPPPPKQPPPHPRPSKQAVPFSLDVALQSGARAGERIQPPQRVHSPAPPVPDAGWGTRLNPVHVYSQRGPKYPLSHYPKFHRDNPAWDVKDRKQKLEGEAREDDIQMYGDRLAKFIRSDLYSRKDAADAAAWYGIKPLGRGGFGMTGLWEKRDEDGQVVDHLVIKQIGKEPGQPWDPDIPQEAVVMEEVRKYLTGNTGIVGFRAYKRYPRREVHRLYMEYCPHGDLHQLIREYRAKKRFVPTAFIWDVFHQLALACQSLEAIPPRAQKTAEDCVRVHRDIKPANVFLGKPRTWDEHGIEIYPTAKLGDFGLAIATGPGDANNPRQYRAAGTPGYMALEQEDLNSTSPEILKGIFNHSAALARFRHLRSRESVRGAHPRLLSPTNVWGIGATVFELMTLKQARYYLYNPAYGLGPDAREGLPSAESLRRDQDMRKRYPEVLFETMRRCLRPNPKERPGVEELVRVTREGREEWWDWLKDGGVDGSEARIPWGAFEELEEGSFMENPAHDNARWWQRGETWKTNTRTMKKENDDDDDDDDESEEEAGNENEQDRQDPDDDPQPRQQQAQESQYRRNRPWEVHFDDPEVDFEYPSTWSQQKRFWRRPDEQ